jgi:2-polyprenyl-3-methyl-5-hydroxy-6-metoxy-1,4-benzoquinol methylase
MRKQWYIFYFLILAFSISCVNKEINTQDDKQHLNQSIEEPNQTVDDVYHNIGRAIWQKPGLVIEKLGDVSDKTIADIGAGTGYFSVKLAPKSKKVIAIEIDTNLLRKIDSLKTTLPLDSQIKLETRLAMPENPNLLEKEVDIILIINTIAYIPNTEKYLKTIKKGLKKGGKIMIIDYKMKKLPINAPPKAERIYLDVLEDLLIKSGYTLIQSDDTSLEYQYIITAQNN